VVPRFIDTLEGVTARATRVAAVPVPLRPITAAPFVDELLVMVS
jgi:hypothetical protein